MKLNKKILYVILIFFSIFLFLFIKDVNFFALKDLRDIKYVKVADQLIKVELAITKEDQEIGLSGRNALKDDQGMLFIFKESGIYNFWMKDMSFPIDIIWIDGSMKVVYIEKNVKPETYPQSFGPKIYSKYVLEVNYGFSEKNNLKENDFINFVF